MITPTLPGFQPPVAESEYDVRLLADVTRMGWHHVQVQSEGGNPAYAFSLGLYANYGHPEIIVLGLPAQTMQQLLNRVAVGVAGAKRRYAARTPYDDVVRGMRVAFVPVARRHYPTYLGYAGWFYRSTGPGFPVLQLVWPDRGGRLPWETGYDTSFARLQPLLEK